MDIKIQRFNAHTKQKYLHYVSWVFGALFLFIGLTGLTTGSNNIFQVTSLIISTPNEVHLQVPFYTHDVQYLYLNPNGLCRFATREMIISYWKDESYYSGSMPSQYTLFVEEAHANYNETRYEESFTSRGFYVINHKAWNIDYASFANNYESRLDGDGDKAIYYAKLYLSSGIPLDVAVAVNSEGWADPDGYPLPNHAIVFTGYDSNGFYYNNPISLNLSKPSCGTNKLISYSAFKDGMENHFWWITAVFPVDYAPIFTSANVLIENRSTIHTTTQGDYTSNGVTLTVPTMKTGSFALMNSDTFRQNYLISGIYSTNYYYGAFIIHPESSNDFEYSIGSSYTPLTSATQFSIPEPPPTPVEEPLPYPYEPLPNPLPYEPLPNPYPYKPMPMPTPYPYEQVPNPLPYEPTPSPTITPQPHYTEPKSDLLWYSFLFIGVVLIAFSLKKPKGTTRRKR